MDNCECISFFFQPHETFFQYLTPPGLSKGYFNEWLTNMAHSSYYHHWHTHNGGAPDHRRALTNINNESSKTPYCSLSIIHQWYMLFNWDWPDLRTQLFLWLACLWMWILDLKTVSMPTSRTPTSNYKKSALCSKWFGQRPIRPTRIITTGLIDNNSWNYLSSLVVVLFTSTFSGRYIAPMQ